VKVFDGEFRFAGRRGGRKRWEGFNARPAEGGSERVGVNVRKYVINFTTVDKEMAEQPCGREH